MKESTLLQLNQILSHFYSKTSDLITNERLAEEPARYKVDKWFNLETAESSLFKTQLKHYKSLLSSDTAIQVPPLVLTILLDTSSLSSQQSLLLNGIASTSKRRNVVLEKWTLAFIPCRSGDGSGDVKGKGRQSTYDHGDEKEEESIQNLYKECILHFRTLYTLLHTLPAAPLVQRLNESGSKKPGGLKIGCRISSDENDSYEGTEEALVDKGGDHSVERVSLREIVTSFGSLCLTISYRLNTAYSVLNAIPRLPSHTDLSPINTTTGLEEDFFRFARPSIAGMRAHTIASPIAVPASSFANKADSTPSFTSTSIPIVRSTMSSSRPRNPYRSLTSSPAPSSPVTNEVAAFVTNLRASEVNTRLPSPAPTTSTTSTISQPQPISAARRFPMTTSSSYQNSHSYSPTPSSSFPIIRHPSSSHSSHSHSYDPQQQYSTSSTPPRSSYLMHSQPRTSSILAPTSSGSIRRISLTTNHSLASAEMKPKLSMSEQEEINSFLSLIDSSQAASFVQSSSISSSAGVMATSVSPSSIPTRLQPLSIANRKPSPSFTTSSASKGAYGNESMVISSKEQVGDAMRKLKAAAGTSFSPPSSLPFPSSSLAGLIGREASGGVGGIAKRASRLSIEEESTTAAPTPTMIPSKSPTTLPTAYRSSSFQASILGGGGVARPALEGRGGTISLSSSPILFPQYSSNSVLRTRSAGLPSSGNGGLAVQRTTGFNVMKRGDNFEILEGDGLPPPAPVPSSLFSSNPSSSSSPTPISAYTPAIVTTTNTTGYRRYLPSVPPPPPTTLIPTASLNPITTSQPSSTSRSTSSLTPSVVSTSAQNLDLNYSAEEIRASSSSLSFYRDQEETVGRLELESDEIWLGQEVRTPRGVGVGDRDLAPVLSGGGAEVRSQDLSHHHHHHHHHHRQHRNQPSSAGGGIGLDFRRRDLSPP